VHVDRIEHAEQVQIEAVVGRHGTGGGGVVGDDRF
jgi:hypothetical protein